MPHTPMHQSPQAQKMDRSMRECIDACVDCARVCAETLTYCLSKGGEHVRPEHLKALQDCVDICATDAAFMVRGSEHHTELCGVCADVCQACAVSCEGFGNDAQMKACAEACRRAAESCRKMSA